MPLSDPKVGGTIAAIVIVVAIVLAVSRSGDTGPTHRKVDQIYFYDLGDKKLYATDPDTLSPTDAPSGFKTPESEPGGVRAYVFGCGDCKEHFIAYLEKYTPEGKKMMESGDVTAIYKINDHVHVRAADGDEWLVGGSEEGKKIVSTSESKCPKGVKVVPCNPALN